MNVLAAICVGVGLGVANFGGLWLTLRAEPTPGGFHWSRIARLLLVSVGFYALTQEGLTPVLEGLGGFWLARTYFLSRVGGV